MVVHFYFLKIDESLQIDITNLITIIFQVFLKIEWLYPE